MQIRIRHIVLAAVIAVLLAGCSLSTSEESISLEQGFLNPPDSAKPRVWWHWMNGNITKDGIKLDLEWMKRIGIGGFQNFDAALMTPQIVENRLVYMTPEWKDAFLYTTELADELGLEMAIAGSPGWSESGGPWVPPEQAMKKLVWSETHIEGGQPFTGTLPKPPSTTGSFQNIGGGRGFSLSGQSPEPPPEYYADAAVVAYRAPSGDVPLADLQPKVTSSGGQFELASLTDGDLTNETLLPAAPVGQKSWIQFEFSEPQSIHGLTIVANGGGFRGFGFREFENAGRALETSSNGNQFRSVTPIMDGDTRQTTISFKQATARFFRVTFITPKPPDLPAGISSFFGPLTRGRGPEAPAGNQIAELVLHTGARVNRFEDKAGFSSATDLYDLATPAAAASNPVSKADVIDLTSNMQPDGTLNWTPPEGRWVVLRLGYSLTGHQNSPASPEATGLEVDKLSRTAVRAYFENYLDQYKDATGGLMGERGLQYMITDSWEAGVQNWTDDMIAEFNTRRGYDIIQWLPVLTGRVVESAESSDRFLWDFRKTIGELTTENHYNELTAILRERNMGRYTESHESGRAYIGDGMDVKSNADIPMSAMWTPRPDEDGIQPRYKADIRESASVAHIYGQNIAAAESLTAIGSAWAWSPGTLKPTADMELANGLNRFVIHTSVHQPVSDKIPGLGLGPFGQWFTRHETWGEQAAPWITYLARSSYMLQQGKFVADIAYFYGEDSNVTALFGNALPEIPDVHNYDFVNADALVNLLSVEDGLITTPSGMSYRLMILDPNSRYMSLPVLRKIRDLVNSGATVSGPKPIGTPSLSDDQAEFETIADQLWGTETGERSIGRGRILAGLTPAQALAATVETPDFSYTKPQEDTELMFVHRRLEDGEIYWVNNRNGYAQNLEATFRVEGKAAELWYPETGKMEPASYSTASGGTTVPLHLDPHEAVFVVFRQPSEAPSRTLQIPVETELATIEGPWEVSFQLNRGAPPSITLDELTSWSDSADPGVKYFSGTGTYTKSIQAPADWLQSGSRLWLDLGEVKELAEVLINGTSLGIVWKTPFRVDVSEALKPGDNTLEIRVTNLWVNRLIGDQQPGAAKYTYTTQAFYQADSPLMPSGLLGQVRIVRSATN